MSSTDHTHARRRHRGRAGAALAALVLFGATACGSAPGPDESAAPQAPPSTASGSAAGTGAPSSPTEAATPTVSGSDGTDGHLEVGPIPETVPESGDGTTTVLDVPGEDSDRGGRRVRYTVEIEGGLGVSSEYFASKVREVLVDERGWEPRENVHFVNVGSAERSSGTAADIRIILGSPRLVDENCAPLRTGGRLSCHARGKVMLNVDRWAHGADTYGSDVRNYRIYQIAHEVGHAIGQGHVGCPAPGTAAPVMVQQTKTLDGCTPWPWPQRPQNR